MTARIEGAALDVLCPMHLVLTKEGRVTHVGPTLAKMIDAFVGRNFFDVFDLRRPRSARKVLEVGQDAPLKLHLRLKQPPHTALKGVIVPADMGSGALLVNLSFGISVVDAVRDFDLTNADFAATDLTIEMLYLVEAKTAAMEASYRLNTRLHGAKLAAEEQAFTDTLTGLKNRRALDTILNRLLQTDTPFAVMQIDLDYFKAVNDTFGHAAGDHVLRKVAEVMVEETREDDLVARVGGDEFTIVLPNVHDRDKLRKIGARIISRLAAPMTFQGTECRVSASIGTVWVGDGDGQTIEGLLSDADVALYASKDSGRSKQTFYDPDLRQPKCTSAPS